MYRFNPLFGIPIGTISFGIYTFFYYNFNFSNKKIYFGVYLIVIGGIILTLLIFNEMRFRRSIQTRIQRFDLYARDLTDSQPYHPLIHLIKSKSDGNLNEINNIHLHKKKYNLHEIEASECGICAHNVNESGIVLFYSNCSNLHTMCGACIKRLLYVHNNDLYYKCPYCRSVNLVLQSN